MGGLHFWLRAEVKELERRTPVLPEQARVLVEEGHLVTVEKSVLRCVAVEEYERVGCKVVEEGSWQDTAPPEAIVIGLKELPESVSPLTHKHIMFGHCYKNQAGWRELLQRFSAGKGLLWDLEFLVDDTGRRVAAFGRAAGFIGMALGLKQWCEQQLSGKVLPPLEYYKDEHALVQEIKTALAEVQNKTHRNPSVLVMGALGRSGRGSVECAERVGLQDIAKWDMEETKEGGPFEQILNVDIFVNDILLQQQIPPFLTREMLDKPRKLSVVVDVSCDTTNPFNPLPVYSSNTTFKRPTLRIIEEPVCDVISIDHLPSLVPFDSSREFAGLLLPHLLQTGSSPVWHRAEQLFREKSALAAQA